jgi:hypothetical protein
MRVLISPDPSRCSGVRAMVLISPGPSRCSGVRAMRRFTIVGVAGLVACRFGGPSANTDDYVASPDAAEASGVDAASLADDAASSGDDGASSATPGDTTTAPSADDATGGDAGTDDAPPGDIIEGGACSGTVAVCDPVHNTGCNSLQQCDVNSLVTTTPTGLCVFGSPAEGGSCLSTIVTESCPPKFTCVSSACRALCFCNGDCPIGQCCSDTSGPPGFTLCRPCP